MHKIVAHNKHYATCTQLADAVTDNFRVVSLEDFRGYDVSGVYLSAPGDTWSSICSIATGWFSSAYYKARRK
jgi:hypothetical protein